MKRTMAGLVICLLLMGGLVAQQQRPQDVELQDAIRTETVDGDLNGAIVKYKALLEKYGPTDRTVAAHALLRMAGAYQKLGSAEARLHYERVVRDFPDQTVPARTAQAWLDSREGATHAGLTQRHLAVPVETVGGRVSPDGQLLSFTGGGAILGVVELRTMGRRMLARGGPSEGYPFSSAWSPDGGRLAFGWHGGTGTELRTVSRQGGGSRVLFQRPDMSELYVHDWSRDGRFVLASVGGFTPTRLVRQELVVIPASGGESRTIRAFEPGPVGVTVGGAAFSPDGRFIVFDRPAVATGRRAMFVMAVGTGRESSLTTDAGDDDRVLGWLPGGQVLYVRNRDAWLIRVAGGQPQGIPVRVASDVGIVTSLGHTNAGTWYIRKTTAVSDVFIATLDPATRRASGSHRPLDGARPDVRRGMASWSPDGSRLAYATDDGLLVQTLATRALRTYSVGVSQIRRPVWQPDGRAIVLGGTDRQGRSGLHRVDLDTDRVDYLGPGFAAFFSPDGQELILTGAGAVPARRRDVSTGVETPIDLQGSGPPRALSPDGRLLARYFDPPDGGRSLSVVPAAGGGQRRSLVDNLVGLQPVMTWSPDGRFLYFQVDTATESDVWSVPVNGGKPEPTGIRLPWVKHMSIHPDGRRLALSVVGERSEVLVWDNVVSGSRPGPIRR